VARLLALALAATVVGSLLGVLLPRPAEGTEVAKIAAEVMALAG
jgi:hypothetical protein